MRKRWILIALAVGLLTVAVTGGAALAWGGPGHGLGPGHGWGRGGHDDRMSDLAGKVAGILGAGEQETAEALAQARQELRDEIRETALNDLAGRVAETLGADPDATASAIEQVADEMRSEALESKLQAAIESGQLTEEQAQEIRNDAEAGGWRGKGFASKGDTQEFANRVGAILGVAGGDVADALDQARTAIMREAVESRLQAAIDSGQITEEQAAEIRERIESGDWRGFGKRGHHGRHGGKGHWGRGRWGSPAGVPAPASSGDSA